MRSRYAAVPMGQPVTVIEKPTSRPDVVRYELNRAITGTGHEVFTQPPHELARRPVDKLARALFETGKVVGVQANANVVTVRFRGEARSSGLRPIFEDLYTYYLEGVPVPRPEDFTSPAS